MFYTKRFNDLSFPFFSFTLYSPPSETRSRRRSRSEPGQNGPGSPALASSSLQKMCDLEIEQNLEGEILAGVDLQGVGLHGNGGELEDGVET